MTTSINQWRVLGLSRVEILVVIAVVAILIALLLPIGFQGVADGDFQLDLEFQGGLSPDSGMRVAVGYGQDPDRYFKGDLGSLLVWNDPADWDGSMPPIRCQYSYALKPEWLGRVNWSGPEVFHRLLFVEYYAANKPAKYRVIPFERRRGQELVELTVPREPPAEDEVWKPSKTDANRN